MNIGVVDIKRGDTHEARPCWYTSMTGYIFIICALCGRRSILRDGPAAAPREDGTRGHTISEHGAVTPSIVCPYPQCTWHIWGRLLDWAP